MSTPIGSSETAKGSWFTRICLALCAIGIVAFVAGALGSAPSRSVAALVSSWLFFTGIAVGGLAFSSLLHLCGGDWAEPLHTATWRLAAFLPAAAVLLLGILGGLAFWAPWVHHMPPHDAFWLATPVFAPREVIVTAVLFLVAWFVVRPRIRARSHKARVYVGYALLYAVVVSIWSFDFVVGPTNSWNSTLIGPHLFVGAFMSGCCVATLVALRNGTLNVGQRRDAGTLILVLSIFWSYQCWAQFLTMWYGNLPEEVGVIIRRSDTPWRIEIGLIILTVAILPSLMLISARGRRSPRLLGAAALSQAVGLWLERDLMVLPSLGGPTAQPFDFISLGIGLGLLGLFLLSIWRALAPGDPSAAPTALRSQPAL